MLAAIHSNQYQLNLSANECGRLCRLSVHKNECQCFWQHYLFASESPQEVDYLMAK